MVACNRDKMMFPGSRIVRVGTPKWKPRHTAILEELLDELRSFLSTRSDMPFEQLQHELEINDVRTRAGGEYVHILYGPEPVFVSSGQLQADIKGLVFKPRARISKERSLVVDL